MQYKHTTMVYAYGRNAVPLRASVSTPLCTILALSNYELARHEDHADDLAALRKLADNVELFDKLADLGACLGGLRDVGIHATGLFDLGMCIRNNSELTDDDEDADGYLTWCRDNMSDYDFRIVLEGFHEA